MDLFLKAKDFLNLKKPFVLFSLPNSNRIAGYFQKDNIAYYCSDFSESGFIFAPFKPEERLLFIPKKRSEVIEITLPELSIKQQQIQISESAEEKEKYKTLIQQTVDFINSEKAQKIVISRNKEISLIHLDVAKLCKRLFALPTNTCRYIWFHPETGLWCGATPEILLETSGDSFSTMALAGTKKIEIKKETLWSAKEILEQRFVKDAILDILSKKTKVLKSSKTYSYVAGNVVHLRTDITGILSTKNSVFDIVATLHPTPAVCGTPKDKALDFILENEGYNRAYYTGYVGIINNDKNKASIYVNLRCMQINNAKVNIYVGGGITFASIPEEEWEETQNKMQTMLAVISPFLK